MPAQQLERVAMVVVGQDQNVRALLPLLPGVIARVDTIAEARRLLLCGTTDARCDARTIVAFTPDFVASFNNEAPEAVGVLAKAWRCIVLTATLGQPAGGWPFTDVALNRLGLGRKDVVSFPVDRGQLEALLATKAGGAR